MSKKFMPPDGRSYLLTKEGAVEKINGKPVSISDATHLKSLGYTVFHPNPQPKKKEGGK